MSDSLPSPPSPRPSAGRPPLDEAPTHALRHSPVHAVIVLSADGVIRSWDAAASRVLGFRPDEVIGQPLAMLFTDEDRARDVPALELRVAAATGHAPDDRWHVRRDGTRIWASGSTLPMLDRGRVVGYLKLLRDRTDQKIEIESLRRRVHDRERADARAAHELRNAIAPLHSSLTLLAHAPAQAQALAPTLQRQLAALTRLVEDLADVASAQHGKLRLQRQPFDIVAELEDVARSVEARAAAKGLRFDVLMPAAAVEVHADAGRLRQVALNLLDNAVKYTGAGGHVWLKLNVDDDNVTVRVSDSGVGISADMLPRIFDFFTQESDDNPGLGVGLAVVRQIMEAHGGVVEVRSSGKGLGSEFAAVLPRCPPDVEPLPRPPAPSASP